MIARALMRAPARTLPGYNNTFTWLQYQSPSGHKSHLLDTKDKLPFDQKGFLLAAWPWGDSLTTEQLRGAMSLLLDYSKDLDINYFGKRGKHFFYWFKSSFAVLLLFFFCVCVLCAVCVCMWYVVFVYVCACHSCVHIVPQCFVLHFALEVPVHVDKRERCHLGPGVSAGTNWYVFTNILVTWHAAILNPTWMPAKQTNLLP